MRRSLASIVILALLLTGCFGAPPADAPAADAGAQTAAPQAAAPTSMATPLPTAAPADTPTEEPVAFVFPTATPEPTPTPIPPSCAEQAAEFTAQANELLREWDDALLLADSTPRIQLPDQIEKLQDLRRRAEDLDAPDCAGQIKGVLVEAMGEAIYSLFDFLEQNSFSIGTDAIIESSREKIEDALHALAAMADYPAPWTPYTIEDIEAMFPQYEWGPQTRREGTTTIRALDAPINLQASHIDGIVYHISASVFLYYPAEHAANWAEIQSAALPFLGAWPDAEQRLTEFGAVDLADGPLEKIKEYFGASTISVSHERYEPLGKDFAGVSIYFPHKGAAGEQAASIDQ